MNAQDELRLRIAQVLDDERKWPDALETADTIMRALPSMGYVHRDEIRVKPLVWVEGGSDAFMHDADFVDTTQTYQIQEGIFWYAAEVHGTPCGSNEAAKAAAQQHYAAQVLAALDATQESTGEGSKP